MFKKLVKYRFFSYLQIKPQVLYYLYKQQGDKNDNSN